MRMPLWLRRWLTNGQDKAWKHTGYRLTTDAHYDYELARKGYERSQRHWPSGRPLPTVTGQDGKITPFRKQVSITTRRDANG